MLSDADIAIVARDRGVPGLAVLLDADRLLEELNCLLPGRRPKMTTVTYLRYKPGTSCLAGLWLETSDGTVELSAKAYRAETYAEASARVERPQLTTWLGPSCLRLDQHLIILRGFPHDRKLKALVRLFGAERGAALLRQTLPDRPDLWGSEIEIVRYKPERRLVAVLSRAGRSRASLKAYDKDNFGAADHDAFDSCGQLRLARRLAGIQSCGSSSAIGSRENPCISYSCSRDSTRRAVGRWERPWLISTARKGGYFLNVPPPRMAKRRSLRPQWSPSFSPI